MKKVTKKNKPINSSHITSDEEMLNELSLLKSENDILRNIIEKLPGNIFWKDLEGRYLGCNTNVAALFGYTSPQQIIGKSDVDLGITAKDYALLKKNDRKALQLQKEINIEEAGFNANHEPAIYLSKKMPLYDGNHRIIGTCGISLDITERKQMEVALKDAKDTAEAASQAKTEFIANMSHDIKTPLSSIIGISELLTYRLDDENQKFAETLLKSSIQLLRFINNCLEISKIENDHSNIESQHFHLIEIINEIYELFEPTIKMKNLVFNIQFDKKIPGYLLGDRSSIYRILLNLIGNAIKFTANGSVTASFTLTKIKRNREAIIQISIADTGIGIAQENQKIIFDRFTKLVPSHKGTHEGSGIGLYIVQTFVKKLRGEIRLISSPGEGSEFIIYLPLQIPLLKEDEYKKSIPVSTTKNLANTTSNIDKTIQTPKTPFHILLVEDNIIAQQIESAMLTSLNCQVEISESGEKALNIFQPGKYDLVLIDIGLPAMQGDEVAKLMRSKESNSDYRVPIIALTAHINSDTQNDYLSSGIDRILSKPLLLEQAKIIINEYKK